MRRKSTFIRKISALMICVLLSAVFATTFAAAEDSDSSVVYVAGNPDLYPIEYYDSFSKQYLGLMPDIYRLISEQTGYTFEYIYPGNINGQERMAKNSQAEIISAYRDGDIDPQYLHRTIAVTTIKTEEKEKTIYVAFSDIASEKLIVDITKALNTVTDSQKLTVLVSHTESIGNYQKYRIWLYILSGVLVLFLVVAVIIFFIRYRRKKKDKKDTMLNTEYGIGNDQYYTYCFENLITDKSKALYYVAYIAFDEKSINQKFGNEECRAIQKYTSEFLNRQATAVDYLALVKTGVYALIYQAANKASASERIANIIKELDLYLTNIKREYSKLFNAGVCMLGENMDCTAETAFYNANQGYLQAVNENQPFAFSTKALITEAHRRESLRRRIIQAISDGEFIFHLQYIADRKGNIIGAEAVSRWQHPQEGLLSPSQYISMINQSDVISLHDIYIFSLICKQLEMWKGSDKEALCLSCNFTRYSLATPDFCDRLRETIQKYEFDRHKLIIEITEDSLSCDTEILKENIQECKKLGFLIALDDIGSGYSALADLYNYPIDIVKVEKDIVLQAMEPKGKMLLDGLIRLAHSMNMKVLCEGIETAEQNDMILNTDCEYIQGFFYSRALPPKESERFLQQHGFTC